MPRDDERRRSRQPSSSPEKRERDRDRQRDVDRSRDKERTRDGDRDRNQARAERDRAEDSDNRDEKGARREIRERRELRERRAARGSVAIADRPRNQPYQNAEPQEDRRRSRRHSSSSPEKPKSKSKPRVTERYVESSNSGSSNALSSDALAKLNAINEGRVVVDSIEDSDRDRDRDGDRDRNRVREKRRKSRTREERQASRHHDTAAAIQDEKRRKKRVASAGEVEKGRAVVESRSESSESSLKKPAFNMTAFREKAARKKWWIVGGLFVLLLIIIIPIAVVEGKKNNGVSGSAGDAGGGPGSRPDNLGGMTQSDVPAWAKGTYYDPFTWYDTMDFNTTVTNETVGGLPLMGLNSTWDDSVAANDNVPPLNQQFNYGKMPIRGINVGGWLAIEPFITPSLFEQFPQSANVVDEYTLTAKLGPTLAAQQLEKHYSSFINKTSFQQIRDAGFDHVRMPYSYWAITTYGDDPYVKQISWRYLLRGIEYARENGLRVNLDLHALPGSQNGWNHSGRQGIVGWLNGTDGDLNGQRSIDLHNQLSQFFSQPRYKNVVAIYGLCNEPRMMNLDVPKVINWTTVAAQTVQKNGITALIAFGDGFLGLPKWKGQLAGLKNLVLDVHQYVIFNTDQIAFDHKTKLNFACSGWSSQMQQSVNTQTGYGPTLCGEWSQADTDCATYLNNVNVGSRWEGTMNVGDPSLNVLAAKCPLKNSQCSCNGANADPSKYTGAYKAWLYDNALASMNSFEQGWGWFYWTWRTEKSVQWSWMLGMQAGILPQKVWDRDGNGPDGNPVFNCKTGDAPDLSKQLPENY